MARKLHFYYTFTPGTKTVVIDGNVNRKRLLLITNTTRNAIIYNLAQPSLGATSITYNPETDKTTVVLTFNTGAAGHQSNDILQIFAEQDAVIFQPAQMLVDPVSKMRVSQPNTLIDTDFEYGLQSTKWETLERVNNIPSFYSTSGDTSLGGVVSITTNGSKEVTITTTNAHGLTTGTPIDVRGLNSITAEGTFLIKKTTDYQFTFEVSTVQPGTTSNPISILTPYTVILIGRFYVNSAIGLDNSVTNLDGPISTDGSPSSTILVTTNYDHGFSVNSPFYLTNTLGNTFVSFDPASFEVGGSIEDRSSLDFDTGFFNPYEPAHDGAVQRDILASAINTTLHTVTIPNHGLVTGDAIAYVGTTHTTHPQINAVSGGRFALSSGSLPFYNNGTVATASSWLFAIVVDKDTIRFASNPGDANDGTNTIQFSSNGGNAAANLYFSLINKRGYQIEQNFLNISAVNGFAELRVSLTGGTTCKAMGVYPEMQFTLTDTGVSNLNGTYVVKKLPSATGWTDEIFNENDSHFVLEGPTNTLGNLVNQTSTTTYTFSNTAASAGVIIRSNGFEQTVTPTSISSATGSTITVSGVTNLGDGDRPWRVGSVVRFSSVGSLTGVSANTDYFVSASTSIVNNVATLTLSSTHPTVSTTPVTFGGTVGVAALKIFANGIRSQVHSGALSWQNHSRLSIHDWSSLTGKMFTRESISNVGSILYIKNHGLSNGQPIMFIGGGNVFTQTIATATVPVESSSTSSVYFIEVVNRDEFKLWTSEPDGLTGAYGGYVTTASSIASNAQVTLSPGGTPTGGGAAVRVDTFTGGVMQIHPGFVVRTFTLSTPADSGKTRDRILTQFSEVPGYISEDCHLIIKTNSTSVLPTTVNTQLISTPNTYQSYQKYFATSVQENAIFDGQTQFTASGRAEFSIAIAPNAQPINFTGAATSTEGTATAAGKFFATRIVENPYSNSFFLPFHGGLDGRRTDYQEGAFENGDSTDTGSILPSAAGFPRPSFDYYTDRNDIKWPKINLIFDHVGTGGAGTTTLPNLTKLGKYTMVPITNDIFKVSATGSLLPTGSPTVQFTLGTNTTTRATTVAGGPLGVTQIKFSTTVTSKIPNSNSNRILIPLQNLSFIENDLIRYDTSGGSEVASSFDGIPGLQNGSIYSVKNLSTKTPISIGLRVTRATDSDASLLQLDSDVTVSGVSKVSTGDILQVGLDGTEFVLVTGISGSTITVTRGYSGTTGLFIPANTPFYKMYGSFQLYSKDLLSPRPINVAGASIVAASGIFNSTAHNLKTGDPVLYRNGGVTDPFTGAALAAGSTVFVITIDANSFKLAPTKEASFSDFSVTTTATATDITTIVDTIPLQSFVNVSDADHKFLNVSSTGAIDGAYYSVASGTTSRKLAMKSVSNPTLQVSEREIAFNPAKSVNLKKGQFVYSSHSYATGTKVTYSRNGNKFEVGRQTSQSFNISNIARTNNVATITFSASHGLTVGQSYQISYLNVTTATQDGFDIVNIVVFAASSNTVTYANTGANVTSQAGAGVMVLLGTLHPQPGYTCLYDLDHTSAPVGNGTTVTYTYADTIAEAFAAGEYVNIIGVTVGGSINNGYNGTFQVTSCTHTTVTVTNTTTGGSPVSTSANVRGVYFVIRDSFDTFRLAKTKQNSLDGIAIQNFSTTGSTPIQPVKFTITNIARDGANLATATIGTHNLIIGQQYTVSSIDCTTLGLNSLDARNIVVTIASSTTITYTSVGAAVTSQAATGTVVMGGISQVGHKFITSQVSGENLGNGTSTIVARDALFSVPTNVRPSTDRVLLTSHGFVTGDRVAYRVWGNGTAISGLVNGSQYFINNTQNTITSGPLSKGGTESGQTANQFSLHNSWVGAYTNTDIVDILGSATGTLHQFKISNPTLKGTTFKGEWSSGDSYFYGDVVIFREEYFMSIAGVITSVNAFPNNNQQPISDAGVYNNNWMQAPNLPAYSSRFLALYKGGDTVRISNTVPTRTIPFNGSTAVNTTTGLITVNNHGLITGDGVIYRVNSNGGNNANASTLASIYVSGVPARPQSGNSVVTNNDKLIASNMYYVHVNDANTFSLHTSLAGADAGNLALSTLYTNTGLAITNYVRALINNQWVNTITTAAHGLQLGGSYIGSVDCATGPADTGSFDAYNVTITVASTTTLTYVTSATGAVTSVAGTGTLRLIDPTDIVIPGTTFTGTGVQHRLEKIEGTVYEPTVIAVNSDSEMVVTDPYPPRQITFNPQGTFNGVSGLIQPIVNITTGDIYIPNHGLATGTKVYYSTGVNIGVRLGGTQVGASIHFVIKVNDDVIRLAGDGLAANVLTGLSNALLGVPFIPSSTGQGFTHYLIAASVCGSTNIRYNTSGALIADGQGATAANAGIVVSGYTGNYYINQVSANIRDGVLQGLPYLYPTQVYTRANCLNLHRPFDGGVEIQAAKNPLVTITRQTRKYFRYQSGKGLQYSSGINFSPSIDVSYISHDGATYATVTTRKPHNLVSGNRIIIEDVEVNAGVNTSYITPSNGLYFTVFDVSDEYNFRYATNGVPSDLNPAGYPNLFVYEWSDAVVRAGMFDDQNGMFFEYDGQEIWCVRRYSTTQLGGTVNVEKNANTITGVNTKFTRQLSSGDMIVVRGMSYKVTAVSSDTNIHISPSYRGVTGTRIVTTKTQEIRTRQTDWSIDNCDGTGISGFNLNIHRMQMAYIDYSWYGAGKVRFGFKGVDGMVFYCHEFIHNNKETEAYMRSGNLPARYEIENKATPTYAPSLYHWGASVIMDGGFEDDKAYLFTAASGSAGNDNITVPATLAGTPVPILSLRLAPSVDSSLVGAMGQRDLINRMILKLVSTGLVATNTNNRAASVRLILNGNLSQSAYFTNYGSPSLTQIIKHTGQLTDTITGGITVFEFRAASGASVTQDLEKLVELGNSVMGGDFVYPNGPDVLTLAIVPTDTVAATTVTARITWSESQA